MRRLITAFHCFCLRHSDRGSMSLESVIIIGALGAAALLVTGAASSKIGEFLDILEGL